MLADGRQENDSLFVLNKLHIHIMLQWESERKEIVGNLIMLTSSHVHCTIYKQWINSNEQMTTLPLQ